MVSQLPALAVLDVVSTVLFHAGWLPQVVPPSVQVTASGCTSKPPVVAALLVT